ncbi:MAG TPA: dihydroorotase [Candidatus Angelobacter sp.]|nr:dihydroorotase [Candidatus Angelobacter sp.]
MQSKNSLLIRDGRLLDPAQKLDGNFDLLLRDGKVAEVAPRGSIAATGHDVLDASGMIVAPGFIDIHVHLREPGQSNKETIATGTMAAAAGGFTSVCPMPNTAPINDTAAITRWMQDPERQAHVGVFPIAAATIGSRGERLTDFSALKRAGAVAVSDDGRPILGHDIMRDALSAAAKVGLPVVQHAEDTNLTKEASMNSGPHAFRLGLRGWPNEAETSIVERDIELVNTTGGRLHVAHLSAAGALQAVRHAKSLGLPVTCEVTPHHFALTDEDVGEYRTNYKMNPPLRSEEDRTALLEGLADGTVDCIATDHAPHTQNEKNAEFDRAPFGITGLETALGLCLAILHSKHKVPIVRIIELLTTNPARIMGLEGRGTLARGSYADVTVFHPTKKWTYRADETFSKSRNSPFDGWKMEGKVTATVVAGKIAYRKK